MLSHYSEAQSASLCGDLLMDHTREKLNPQSVTQQLGSHEVSCLCSVKISGAKEDIQSKDRGKCCLPRQSSMSERLVPPKLGGTLSLSLLSVAEELWRFSGFRSWLVLLLKQHSRSSP